MLRLMTEGAAVLLGIGLLVAAAMMDEHWVITHFPPDYFPPYSWIDNVVLAFRTVLAASGAATVLLARRQAEFVLEHLRDGAWILSTITILAAVALALGAAELILRSSGWQSEVGLHDRFRQRHPVFGWTVKPSSAGYWVTGGRRIAYAYDAFGYREPDEHTVPDFSRPTIVLAGESVLGGFGLEWTESIAGQLSQRMGVQTADLSVGGYATDQTYLRLRSELPRFHRPVAVVFLFSPMLFRRNGEDARPHLGPDLVLRPAVERAKLVAMARWAIPYRNPEETARAILTTRAILTSVVRLSSSRGAAPVILVPQFMPESLAERQIRLRVLENTNLPVVYVPLDAHWHLPGDWHPDARAANAMATAIYRYLEPRTSAKCGPVRSAC